MGYDYYFPSYDYYPPAYEPPSQTYTAPPVESYPGQTTIQGTYIPSYPAIDTYSNIIDQNSVIGNAATGAIIEIGRAHV